MTSLANDVAMSDWRKAIQEQPWGVQHAIKTSLEVVQSGDIKMCFNADDFNGAPCLINSINMMLSQDSSKSPSRDYPNVVRAFDNANQLFFNKGVNKDQLVSPLGAEILLKNMGPMKEQPSDTVVMPTGEELAEWLSDPKNLAASEPAQEILEEIMRSD